MERLTLLLNHVLAGEPAARDRLRPHIDRILRIEMLDWPKLLPAVPDACFRITPAGLLEWCEPKSAMGAPELLLSIDASNPALMLFRGVAGERPRVDVRGDATFAADVSWLIDNLRWDVRDDLARIVGPAWAERIGNLGQAIAAGLRTGLQFVASRGDRRPE
jgi:ubiquinone biosynthesis accessory factor UbiJ